MKKHIEKMTDDELKKWLIVNARSVGKTTAILLIAEELAKRTIFNPKQK
jgi:DNA polymerase III delta prime subunit